MDLIFPKVGDVIPVQIFIEANDDALSTSLAFDEFRGKVVVLNYWARWCGYCRRENEYLKEVAGKFRDRPVVVLAVNCDADRSTAAREIARHGLDWPHWWDGQDGKVARQWRIDAYPTTYLLDHKGLIQEINVSGNGLEPVVNRLLEQLAADPPVNP